MLFLKTVQSNAFKTMVEVLKDILHDVSITFDSSGMRVMTLDGCRVAVVHLRLLAENFEEYRCPSRLNIGVNLTNLNKVLKWAGNNDTIVMEMTPDNSSELMIRVENGEKRICTTFEFKLMDVDEENMSMPDIEFNSVITMPSAYFQRLCKDMSNIAEVVHIRSTDNKLVLACQGDFARQETCIEDATGSVSGVSFDCHQKQPSDEIIEGKFLLKYLLLFNKAASLTNTLELYFKQQKSTAFVVLKYNVANLGELMFILSELAD